MYVHMFYVYYVLGMVTNGEHNGLRMRGNTRPFHVLQVRADVRAAVTKMSTKTLLAMLTLKR